MENDIIKVNSNDFNKLIQDVAMIKHFLIGSSVSDPEGELSDWAKKELEKTENTPNSDLISMEEIEREFL